MKYPFLQENATNNQISRIVYNIKSCTIYWTQAQRLETLDKGLNLSSATLYLRVVQLILNISRRQVPHAENGDEKTVS